MVRGWKGPQRLYELLIPILHQNSEKCLFKTQLCQQILSSCPQRHHASQSPCAWRTPGTRLWQTTSTERSGESSGFKMSAPLTIQCSVISQIELKTSFLYRRNLKILVFFTKVMEVKRQSQRLLKMQQIDIPIITEIKKKLRGSRYLHDYTIILAEYHKINEHNVE